MAKKLLISLAVISVTVAAIIAATVFGIHAVGKWQLEKRHQDWEERIAESILWGMDHRDTFTIHYITRYETEEYFYYEMKYSGQLNDFFVEMWPEDDPNFTKVRVNKIYKDEYWSGDIWTRITYDEDSATYLPTTEEAVYVGWLDAKENAISVKHYTDEEIAETLAGAFAIIEEKEAASQPPTEE